MYVYDIVGDNSLRMYAFCLDSVYFFDVLW